MLIPFPPDIANAPIVTNAVSPSTNAATQQISMYNIQAFQDAHLAYQKEFDDQQHSYRKYMTNNSKR
jgi:hypothetical protein